MKKMIKFLKWVIVSIFSTLLLFYMIFVLGPIFLAQILMVFSTDSYHPVSSNPNDIWIGGSDGGIFLEITLATPPYYCVKIKSEELNVIESGKIFYKEGELAMADFNIYSKNIYEHKNGIFLKNNQILLIEPTANCKL